MKRYRMLIVIAVATLVVGRFISPLIALAQDEDGDSVHDQLRIMTQILEASVGNDTIDRRVQQSVFDSRIRSEYIPTVGAIFTIPINFPLHPSEEEKGNGTEDVIEEDLWEHFSGASENTSRAAALAVPPLPNIPSIEPLNIRINVDKSSLDEKAVLLKSNVSYMDAIPLIGVLKRGLFDLSIGDSKPYDPVKISTLTRTVIETIAQYGHRLKSLPNSERVLVVLEAPRPRGSAVHVVLLEEDVNLVYTPEHRASEILKETKKVVRRQIEELQERSDRSRIVRDRGITYWTAPVLGQGEHDRRLLAFKKSDLQQERTYDSIKGKVETTDY